MGDERYPSYYELLMSGPSVAQVEELHKLPDLNVVARLPVIEAFRGFMDFANRAIGNSWSMAYRMALEKEASLSSESSPSGSASWIVPLTAEKRKDIKEAVLSRRVERIAPLYSELSRYASQWAQHPMTLNRLAWMTDEVDAVVQQLRSRNDGRVDVPKEWAELRDGLRSIIQNLGTANGAPNENADNAVDRIEWRGSTIEFVTIFRNLCDYRYVDLPSTGGKQGEGNLTEYIRRLQQLFIVRKGNGEEFSTEGLAQRWRGTPMAAEREQKFVIPEATRKRTSA